MSEPLVDRLLADAEARAARAEPREALLLLRWAATIAPRAAMPRVLLAFHRVRALHATGSQIGSIAPAVPPVESDHLGFPVPRFASRRPELDRTAFIPAPRFTMEPRLAPRDEPLVSRGRTERRCVARSVAMCVAGAVVAVYLLLPGRTAAGGTPTAEAAAAALRLGNAREAVAMVDRLPAPDPRALVVRGRALLAVGDTQGAVVSLQKAVEHPGATAEETFVIARELAKLPCCADRAADAYLIALQRGVTNDHLPEIAKQLERAGRMDQARRVRALGAITR